MGEQRTRLKDTFVRQYGSESVTTCGGTVTSSTPSLGTVVGNGDSWSMTDVVDKDWRGQSRKGVVFNNPVKMLKVSTQLLSKSTRSWQINLANCSCTPSTTVRSGTAQGAYTEPANSVPSSTLFTPSVDLETAKTLAGTAAQANIAEPDVMGLVDVAELGKTVRMLREPVFNLRRLVANIQKDHRKSRKAVTVAQYVAGNWLKYRYGILPLVMSIQGTMKALTKERVSQRMTARGASYVPGQSYNSTLNLNVPSGQAGWNRVIKWTCGQSHTVRAGVLYEYHTSLSSDLGFTLTEIPPAAWELIPFSFVADWFANMGDYIRAVTPKTGLRILASWTTVTRSTQYNYEQTGSAVNVPGGCYTYSGGPGFKFIRTEREVTRSPGISVGLASKLSEIDFARRKDLIHAADALALIAVLFGGKPRGPTSNFGELRV